MAIIPMTREEYQKKFGASPPIADKPTFTPTEPKTFGQKVVGAADSITDFFGARGVADQYGSSIAKATLPKEQRQYVEEPGLKKVVGSAIQSGANLIPGLGVGAKILPKIGAGLATGYTFDVGAQLQNKDKTVGESFSPDVGTVVGGALPVAGAGIRLGSKVISRLFKGLGSGLSGVSTETIDRIVQNPRMAQKATEKLNRTGNNRVLEENARQIMGGVSKIRAEASTAYNKGLEELSDIDINPENLKNEFSKAIQKNNILIDEDGAINLSNADFLDPRIQQKAENIINTINSQTDLSGKGIRKLIDIIENSKFKTAPDGDRQAFNAFINDLKSGLKEGVNQSTPKLGEINKKYSSDMQLVETVEDIFGKVNYRNLPEVVKASQKLEGLFNQKGLAPEVVDDFLKRIGVDPEDFKTTEAVRQISSKAAKSNEPGASLGEVARATTSAVVTPKMVRDIATKVGIAQQKVGPLLEKMNPTARNILIQTLLPAEKEAMRQATPLLTTLSIQTGLSQQEIKKLMQGLDTPTRNILIQSFIQNQ